ncbi:MAG: cellulase [Burkholderiales bacterium]|nr:cellulase [Burkholderiales bacterium]
MRALCLLALFFAAAAQAQDWDMWDRYAERFVQQDGRTIDYSAADKTTSEGQAYTLFFALVANDRARFDRILGWTRDNLAQGDLSARLPAWSWGKRVDGSWGVIDPNAASDADMWLAYALLEAGQLWGEARYRALGALLVARIGKEEVVDLPGLGPMLIPGPQGFHPDAQVWRLNPSYMPIQILRRFAEEEPEGPWEKIAENSLRLIKSSSPHRLAPDWAAYRVGKGFVIDPVNGDVGGYDAIRVYLWAGMLADGDRLRHPLLSSLSAMRGELKKNLVPPAIIHAASGAAEGSGPIGYTASLLPYLKALGEERLLRLQQERMKTVDSIRYYDRVLSMFGEGWLEGRFRFDISGHCVPKWKR